MTNSTPRKVREEFRRYILVLLGFGFWCFFHFLVVVFLVDYGEYYDDDDYGYEYYDEGTKNDWYYHGDGDYAEIYGEPMQQY